MNTVTYFKDGCEWGYKVKHPNSLWMSFGYKTKKAAMRDYKKYKQEYMGLK